MRQPPDGRMSVSKRWTAPVGAHRLMAGRQPAAGSSARRGPIEILHGGMGDLEQQRVVEDFGNAAKPVHLLALGAVDATGEGKDPISLKPHAFAVPRRSAAAGGRAERNLGNHRHPAAVRANHPPALDSHPLLQQRPAARRRTCGSTAPRRACRAGRPIAPPSAGYTAPVPVVPVPVAPSQTDFVVWCISFPP